MDKKLQMKLYEEDMISKGNLEAGRLAREESMRRVENAADPEATHLASECVIKCARTKHKFTTDDVWNLYKEAGGVPPREPKFIGPIMVRAMENGIIVRTGETRLSRRPECHARPIRIWLSLICD